MVKCGVPMTDLAFEIANKQNQLFSDKLIHDHQDAMLCRDCEDVIRLGLDAFASMENVESTHRKGVELGLVPDAIVIDQELYNLRVRWMETCNGFIQAIETSKNNRYIPEQLEDFEEAMKAVSEKIQRFELFSKGRNRLLESLSKEEW